MKKFTLLLVMLLGVLGVKADDVNVDFDISTWGWSWSCDQSYANNVMTVTLTSANGALSTGWGEYQDWSGYSTINIVMPENDNTWFRVYAVDKDNKNVFNKELTYSAGTKVYSVSLSEGRTTGADATKVKQVAVVGNESGNIFKISRIYLTSSTARSTTEIAPTASPTWGWNSSYNSDTKLIDFGAEAWNAYGWSSIDNTGTTYKSLVLLFEPLSASVEFDVNGSKASDVAKDGVYAIADVSASATITNTGIKNSAAGQKVRLKKAYLSTLSVAEETAFINAHDYPLITSLGYTTHITERAIDFTGSDLEAYIAQSVGTDNITFKKVTSVPSGKALLLKGDAGCYQFEKGGLETEDVSANQLKGSDGTVAGASTKYILSKSGSDPVFAPTTGLSYIPKGRAYIETDPGAPLFLSFEEETTTVKDIENARSMTIDGVYYNLNGQRISHPSKGLYIVNGKKIIVK